MHCENNEVRRKMIQDGEHARDCLKNALTALDNARGWGIYDMLGGGFISTIIKHSKMDKASEYIEEAKSALMRFNHELSCIQDYANVDLSTGDFWGFSDWFFDGLLSDWIMQGRINEARKQIQQAMYKVDIILERLR